MNISLKTLTLLLAAAGTIALAAVEGVENVEGAAGAAVEDVENVKGPAAAVEKAKEVVAAVQDVNAAGAAAAVENVEGVEKVEGAADAAIEKVEDVQDVQDVQDAPATGDDELEGVTVTSGDDPDKITVSLDAVELEDVVRLFTRLSGANIICNTTNLNGTVTANLVDIAWEPALRSILRQQGLALLEDPLTPGVYEIGVQPPRGLEPFVTRSFKLNYLNAASAAEIVKKLLGIETVKGSAATRTQKKDKEGNVIEEIEAVSSEQKGYVVAHSAANTVVVSCRGDARMREVEKVLTDLDIVRPQVYIEAKIVQISGSAAKKIGIDWSFLDGYTIKAGPFAREYTRANTRDKSISGVNLADHARYRGTAESSMVKSETALATEIEVNTYGPEFPSAAPWSSLYRSSPAAVFTGNNGTWSSESYSKTQYRDENKTDVRTAIFSAPAMQLAISALETSDDVAQISNPKLIVANEERAVIDMTQKIPYVTVQMDQDGTGTSSTYKYSTSMSNIPVPQGKGKDGKDIPIPVYIDGAFFSAGIRVDVTPRINNSSNITVVIEPSLSEVIDYIKPAGDDGTKFPIINLRTVNTTFALGNGQTAVIGGLTTTGDKEVVKKVPILGSIPILKYLFSHTEKIKEQYETIIFVTVGIVDPDKKETTMGLPDGARLVQKRIDSDGKIIDKRFKDMETKEQALEADLREAEAKGLVVPEVVEE